MSFESELRDRLAASANRFDADPAVLADAQRRAGRMVRARRRSWALAAAAVLVLIAALAVPLLTESPQDETPVIAPVPSERHTADDGSTAPDPETGESGEAGDTDGGTGTWTSITEWPHGPRVDAAAAWTGQEMFVWGGSSDGAPQPGGAMYDPATDLWREIAAAPSDPRVRATAVWTGEEVLIFGGDGADSLYGADPDMQLLAYDPASDSWRVFDDPPLDPRTAASVTWTGDELIVWGGVRIDWSGGADGGSAPGPGSVETFADGAAFDPGSGSWRRLGDGPLAPRGDHGAVWNGRRLVVFGGGTADSVEGEFSWFGEFHDAAAYDPATDTWTAIESPGTIGPLVAAHWTGDGIVYWTGHVDPQTPGNWLEPGAVWDVRTGRWEPMAWPPFAQRRDRTSTVWADEPGAMITWGGMIGEGGNRHFSGGASFHPGANSWEPLPDAGLGARNGHVAVWTGRELLVWGGATDGSGGDGFGGEYVPRADGAVWRP